MKNKILSVVAILVLFVFSSQAQNMKKTKDYDPDKHTFHVHQHVMVTLESGKEVQAIIHGHVSKKKYYVRQYKSRRQGKVHEKYMRPLTESEMSALKLEQESRKKK